MRDLFDVHKFMMYYIIDLYVNTALLYTLISFHIIPILGMQSTQLTMIQHIWIVLFYIVLLFSQIEINLTIYSITLNVWEVIKFILALYLLQYHNVISFT